ncbi:hypothetical protein TSOC_000200 [Tetrabaena socialis]|uniref:Uncharacterized protein n=1 Tax=Tetrabaena socialis TaxID=47790 RepID=A0A2J8AJY1_9CHLO|nr:hypothetical protein TSOC_000200 [Tetrabaena socialis]|eukprot:PNH12832.1 hypothetical protein TSOC_000200 [Tetrabaena socialis]
MGGKDEPTSGLDAANSGSLIHLLHDLADESGMNIIAVLHQPRFASFEQLTSLLLLGPAGNVLFQGRPEICVLYFRTLGFE